MSVTIAGSTLSNLPNDFTLSNSRVNLMLKADSLEEAQHMGIIDRLIDYIFGGGKREAIAEAFTAICAKDSPNTDSDTRKLNRFETLKTLAMPEHADKFKTEVSVDSENGRWGYEFSIDNTSIFKSESREIGSGHALATYQDSVLLSKVTDALKDHPAATTLLSSLQSLAALFADRNEAAFQIPHRTVDQAEKFTLIANNLREHGVSCAVTINTDVIGLDQDGNDICQGSFSMAVNGRPVHAGVIERHPFDAESPGSAQVRPRDVEPSLHELQQTAPLTAVIVAALDIEFNTDLTTHNALLTDSTNFIESRLQTMVDLPEHDTALRAALDDPAFGSQAYTGHRPGATEATFVAIFGDRELVLSNRDNNNGELRGESLRQVFETANFTTLRDILGVGHLTEKDSLLRYLSTAARNTHYSSNVQLMTGLEREQIHDAVHSIPIHNSTMGKIFGTPAPTRLGVEPDDAGLAPHEWA